MMTGVNVVLQGDSSSIWIDPVTRHTRRIQVNTIFKGDPVQLTATFNTLPRGRNHMANNEFDVMGMRLTSADKGIRPSDDF